MKYYNLFVYLLEQNVIEHYQNAADIGPIINLHYQIQTMFFDKFGVKYSNKIDGWNIHSDTQCQVYKNTFTFKSADS